MPKYRVRVCREKVWDVLIEAESAEDAEEKVDVAITDGLDLEAMKDGESDGAVQREIQDFSEDAHVLTESAEEVEA